MTILELIDDYAESVSQRTIVKRVNAMTCKWTQISTYTYSTACGGKVTFFLGEPSDHVCTCGRKAV